MAGSWTEKRVTSPDTEAVCLAPTSNARLPLAVGTFASLPEGLDYAARGETGYNFFSGRGAPAASLSYRTLRERAVDLAVRLVAAGLPRGGRVALIAETTVDFLTLFYACQYAALVPMPLPLSMNVGGHEAYVARLRGMLRSGQPVAAMASADLIKLLREAAEGLDIRLVGTPDEFYGLPVGNGAPRPFGEHDSCYIQYSSGSTTEPRGVLVTQRAITANARAMSRDGLALRAGDRATSWLPLYHDMGLVGFCLAPMLSQITVDYIATSTFALRPRTWLKLISEYGGTISFSPTFGYELCMRRVGKEGGGAFDLSRWRVAGVGGEMVRPDVLDEFARSFAPAGFDRRAFLPCYGLAEATLAVSFTALGAGVRVDTVDREAYERTGKAVPAPAEGVRSRSFVAAGRPLPGYRVEIRDDAETVLAERTIGRVVVHGPSLMQEYFRDPERTRQVILSGGWLDTGDMGYLVDGELVVTGRRKDMIIANGRNIWPQDLEWSVEQLPGVRSGSVAAFAVADEHAEERVVLVVECYASDRPQQVALRRDVHATIQKTAGVHCDVVLVAPRSLPYTSSGKLSRAAAREQYVNGALQPLDMTDRAAVIQPTDAAPVVSDR